ncbi:MAG: helix-turn-helix transcriptional regulator [Candidatus Paceibacterota bacterium]
MIIMHTEEIKIDLTEIKDKKSRDSVKSLIEAKGIPFQESFNFWTNFENDENDENENTIVFSDLHSLGKHILNTNRRIWEFRVKKRNPYFISFIRNNRDEKFTDLIDDILRASYNRLTVFDATNHFSKSLHKKDLIDELLKIVSRNFEPDSLKSVVVNKKNNSFLIELNNGLYGEVTFSDLQLNDITKDLLLDSLKISDQGNSIEIYTNDGEVFDIDADVLKSFFSSDSKKKIKDQTQLTANNIGELLRGRRKEKNITQKELSNLTDIDQAIISKIETGKHLPRFDTLERIGNGLGMNVSELLQN